MDVGEAWGIRDNRFGDERAQGNRALHTWEKSRVLNHICHELCRISTDRIELQASSLYKARECVVRGQADSMTMAKKLNTKGNERLDITSTPNNLYDDV
ncbi:hypothetical protein AAE478_006357 [Parahypoxylon ruwenzoriense]